MKLNKLRTILISISFFIFVLASIFLLPSTFQFIFPDKIMCAEGCSQNFRNFIIFYYISSLVFSLFLGVRYSYKKISLKKIGLISFAFEAILLIIIWYATGQGYGLHYSY